MKYTKQELVLRFLSSIHPSHSYLAPAQHQAQALIEPQHCVNSTEHCLCPIGAQSNEGDLSELKMTIK